MSAQELGTTLTGSKKQVMGRPYCNMLIYSILKGSNKDLKFTTEVDLCSLQKPRWRIWINCDWPAVNWSFGGSAQRGGYLHKTPGLCTQKSKGIYIVCILFLPQTQDPSSMPTEFKRLALLLASFFCCRPKIQAVISWQMKNHPLVSSLLYLLDYLQCLICLPFDLPWHRSGPTNFIISNESTISVDITWVFWFDWFFEREEKKDLTTMILEVHETWSKGELVWQGFPDWHDSDLRKRTAANINLMAADRMTERR